MTDAAPKTLREGSAAKREAILEAARDLFLTDGFERTSVDAVAARATVSKRTVYDYFGDKRTLLVAVIDQAGSALLSSITGSLERHLGGEIPDLEAALTGFAVDVAESTMGSADYVTVVRLTRNELGKDPALLDNELDTAPEVALAARFQDLADRGILEIAKPRVAADHFIALTILFANSRLPTAESGQRREVDREMITEGVRAFIRAYAPRP
jgi:TetR/AcrR family transcriptional repressor of mexJK operon